MSGAEIAVLVVVCVAFVAAVNALIIGKLKHKGGCGCGNRCSGCCADCKTATKYNTQK